MNPLNQLPIDAAMVARVDDFASTLAKETGHTVLAVVFKEDGKLHVALDGVPESGWVKDLTADVPTFLRILSDIFRLNDAIEARQAKS